MSSTHSDIVQNIKDAYLKTADYNIIGRYIIYTSTIYIVIYILFGLMFVDMANIFIRRSYF